VRFFFFILAVLLAEALPAQDINAIANSGLSDTQKADSLMNIARRYTGRAKTDSAIITLEVARPFVMRTTDPIYISRFYVVSGQYLLLKNKYSSAIQELGKAIPYFTNQKNFVAQGNCYYLLGRGFLRLNQFDSARIYLAMAEETFAKQDAYRNWQVYAELGELYKGARNFTLAEEYFLKAYKLTKEKGIRMDHGVMLSNMTSYYSYSKDAGKYAAYTNEEINFYNKGSSSFISNPVHNLVFADLDKLPKEEKIQFLLKVKEALLNNSEKINAAYVASAISSIYEGDNQPEMSLPYMKESAALTSTHDNISNHLVYSKAVFRLLMKAGKTEDALKQSDYVFILTDSITNRQRQEKLQELETKYQAEKKQQEIVLLNSKNDLSRKEIELLKAQTLNDSIQLLRETEQRKALFRENLLKETALVEQQKNVRLLSQQNSLKDSIVQSEKAYNALLASENSFKEDKLKKEKELMQSLTRENILQGRQVKKERQTKWLLAGGVALALVSGLSIYSLYKKQKAKNNIIQKQAEDLEVLMKEIHHRVKNNLQVVSSLLDLQSHSISDVQAHEAVKEGKNRVQSMALIHQNLYSEGNIKGIRLKEYVSNLLQTLCDSYNITNDKVKINANIDDMNLDVDTMIPLGLVLNELVSNSFKYAFREKNNGELNIILKEQADQLHLMVCDNGGGFPAGLDVKTGKSFGMKMIRAFAQKLKAKLEVYNNNGAVVEMLITKFKTA
jgi:two-component sensor histidine kinase